MSKVTKTKASRSNKVVAKTTATRRTPLTSSYTAISNNIYHDGFSYRVRVSISGTKYSKNFPSKKAAYAYRKQLLSAN